MLPGDFGALLDDATHRPQCCPSLRLPWYFKARIWPSSAAFSRSLKPVHMRCIMARSCINNSPGFPRKSGHFFSQTAHPILQYSCSVSHKPHWMQWRGRSIWSAESINNKNVIEIYLRWNQICMEHVKIRIRRCLTAVSYFGAIMKPIPKLIVWLSRIPMYYVL